MSGFLKNPIAYKDAPLLPPVRGEKLPPTEEEEPPVYGIVYAAEFKNLTYYIGQTRQRLHLRVNGHRAAAKRENLRRFMTHGGIWVNRSLWRWRRCFCRAARRS